MHTLLFTLGGVTEKKVPHLELRPEVSGVPV